MKVELLEIKPQGAVVQLAGKNGQGKTSAALAIITALGGRGALAKALGLSKAPGDDALIRAGAKAAEVVVQFDGYVVTWSRERGSGVDKVEIRGADGGRHGQRKLAGMVGSIAFDPMAFDGMRPTERRKMLLELVGVDLDEIEDRRDTIYQKRRDVNRDHKAALARVGEVIEGARSEAIDVSALELKLDEGRDLCAANLRQKQDANGLDMKAGGERDYAERAAEGSARAEGDESRLPAAHEVALKLMSRRHRRERTDLANQQKGEATSAASRSREARASADSLSKAARATTVSARTALEAAGNWSTLRSTRPRARSMTRASRTNFVGAPRTASAASWRRRSSAKILATSPPDSR